MFYLYMQQTGEGCHYTIGCAQKLVKLKATMHSEIECEVKQVFEDHGIGGEERELQRFLILQDITGISYSAWYAECVDARQARLDEMVKAKKRAQLEQLKRDLGEG